MKKRVLFSLLIMMIALLGSSCTTGRSVSRVGVDEQIDLSGRWNDTDSRLVAQEMIEDVLRRPWLSDFRAETGEKPRVIVGQIRNRSSEHIEVNVFVKDIERELINSGMVSFVASSAEREAIRDERMDQQMEADPATIARLGKESGANFMLIGIITSQTDAVDGQKVTLYKTDLELIDIESNEKVWIGSKSIKKLVTQSKYRM
jgi:uncharacterized protein (TIGR02722 family)